MSDVEWMVLETHGETAGEPELVRLLAQTGGKTEEPSRAPASAALPVVGVFRGFSLDESPFVALPTLLPNEILTARTVVSLRRDQVGAEVLVLCEQGDPHRPIVIGVLRERVPASAGIEHAGTTIVADDERYVLAAEREIVLRCGDSSITLTRAGKVIIKGNYILSRSSGYNKIKGAAVDIN